MKNTSFLKGKTILITGGTGSFGSGFTRFLLDHAEPKKIIIFSRDELKQFNLANELSKYAEKLRFFIGDVRDLSRLERAFRGVDVVVHAAALKQVPMLEYNPSEAIQTNIGGSQNVINAAIDQCVPKVLLISTDKAAEPINLYGATKLCAEKLFIASNVYTTKTVFSAVRYGNVIGSRGSIVESLRKTKEGAVFVTDEAMTRFWLKLERAYDLVLYALENMQGGEIFIPKVPSMKMTDLFNVLAPGRERKIIGIRPGEKMHEVLLTDEESIRSYDLGDYYVILPAYGQMAKSLKVFFEKKGSKLPVGFRFQSNTNDNWLLPEELISVTS